MWVCPRPLSHPEICLEVDSPLPERSSGTLALAPFLGNALLSWALGWGTIGDPGRPRPWEGCPEPALSSSPQASGEPCLPSPVGWKVGGGPKEVPHTASHPAGERRLHVLPFAHLTFTQHLNTRHTLAFLLRWFCVEPAILEFRARLVLLSPSLPFWRPRTRKRK